MQYGFVNIKVLGRDIVAKEISRRELTSEMRYICMINDENGKHEIYFSKNKNSEQWWCVKCMTDLEKLIKTYSHDPFRAALFTAFSANELTTTHFIDLYDIDRNIIKTEGLDKSWQTSTSRKVTRCAFNLFNGYTGEEDEEARFYSLYNVLDLDTPTRKKLLEAVEILFGKG